MKLRRNAVLNNISESLFTLDLACHLLLERDVYRYTGKHRTAPISQTERETDFIYCCTTSHLSIISFHSVAMLKSAMDHRCGGPCAEQREESFGGGPIDQSLPG
ncbi:conserved hypothetical protein [Trichinella spiralis]|uniref:hypothetical protein n=1 Tax=Trichinella spiralis TaxID=6334 RepID=UPI0001EFB672|nr:conserved hypothetical protein [Trichinella spiralis]